MSLWNLLTLPEDRNDEMHYEDRGNLKSLGSDIAEFLNGIKSLPRKAKNHFGEMRTWARNQAQELEKGA